MIAVIETLEKLITAAMVKASSRDDCAAMVRPSTDEKFGDYQANGVMALAKKLKTSPRALAETVVAALDLDNICLPPEIAGPGFINLRLKPEFLTQKLLEINADAENRLAVEKSNTPETVVVDFSGPNIAKQMHVGHLRSTIIGDSIARMLEFLGHNVIKQNHIGDWGTQFGMLIAYHRRQINEVVGHVTTGDIDNISHISELEEFYRESKKLYDSDESFAQEARECVVKLQQHNPVMLSSWERIVEWSRKHYQPIYNTLQVNLHEENERGESFYADKLPDIVEELKKQKLASESQGAMCVFPEGFKNKEGDPLPFIIQKTDGAYLYATTDLAAIRYRLKDLKAKRIIYVTDARQKLHFQMLFATTKMAGWADDNIKLEHISFGSVLGEGGKPFKTRSGQSVKLAELLTEAVTLARKVVETKNPDLTDKEKETIARAVGIGAVKYADYSNNRESDYIFSFEKMLAMEGNTAPYMQYAYARIKSIERKGAIDIADELTELTELNLTEPAELDLGKHIIRYCEAIKTAAADCRPNYLTTYLYELAQKFSAFYNNCPVLKAAPDKRPTRLLLCRLTEKTIQHGLKNLLGIDVVDKM